MNIEQIQEEMKKINENPNLMSEVKITRIRVYQTFIEQTVQEEKYNEEMLEFLQGASEMVRISGGSYQIEAKLDYNKLALKGSILDSDLVKDLNAKGIEDFSLVDLKTLYSPLYEQEHDVDMTETNLAMSLYSQVEDIEKTEQRQMEIISRNLGELLGKDIVSKTNEKGVIQRDGKTVVELTDKSEEQLEADYHTAMSKIDELYVNEGILDLPTKKVATQMLSQLFNYYKNGNKKVPINVVEQMQVSPAYEECGKNL